MHNLSPHNDIIPAVAGRSLSCTCPAGRTWD